MRTSAASEHRLDRLVGRLLYRHAPKLRQRFCDHAFAIEDLATVPGADHETRVRWPCASCGKVFRAHCGLDISPKHGFTFRRGEVAELPKCFSCNRPINTDDDAHVCIKCGGRNSLAKPPNA